MRRKSILDAVPILPRNFLIMQPDELTSEIISASIKVHKALGPGLFESVYEEVLAYELSKNGFHVERQVAIPVHYESIRMEVGFRADLIVEETVVVEIKSVEKLSAVHKKQVMNYLRLTTLQVGLLINFNEILLKEGLHRFVNNYSLQTQCIHSLQYSFPPNLCVKLLSTLLRRNLLFTPQIQPIYLPQKKNETIWKDT